MKIAFVGSLPAAAVLPPEVIRESHRGGNHPAPWIVALLPALARVSGFKMRVILVQRAILRPCLVERDGVEYQGIPYPFPERYDFRTFHGLKTIIMRRAIRRFDPDVVHAFGMETGSAVIALGSGYPVSCFIQGIVEKLLPFYGERPWVDRQAGLLEESHAVRRIGWFVAETRFARDWAMSRNPAARVALIPHPLRSDFLEQAAPRFDSCVLTVGGLDSRKGMDTVIKAFARVRQPLARLVVVGSGPLRASLEGLAADLGVGPRVEFTGAISTEQVIERMNAASVLVIASRMDTSPNVVSEAHAIGLPVIGTRAGGIPEMIDEGGDGYQVEVDDFETMALRMESLLADPAVCRRLGAAGRAKVEILNAPEAVAEAHREFFLGIERDLAAAAGGL